MGDLAEQLKTATMERSGGTGHHGESVIDGLLRATTDPEDKKELLAAISDYDISRGVFRVSSRKLSLILADVGIQISPATVGDYRKRNKLRDKALRDAGLVQ